MTHNACRALLTGFFSKRWKAASQSACGHAKAVSPSAVMYVSHHAACICGMRHGRFLRRERVRSKPGASGDLGLVRAYRAFRAFRAFHMRDAGEESDVELWPRAGEQAGRVPVS